MSFISANAPAVIGRAIPYGVIFADAGSLEDLQERRTEILARVAEIEALDEPDDDTQEELDGLLAEAEKLGKRIEQKQRIAALQPQGRGRQTSAEPNNGGAQNGTRPAPRGNPVAAQPRANDPRHGFQNFGEFARHVYGAGIHDHAATERLMNVATTFGSESVGADGGFAVPPEFQRSIWTKVMEGENLLARCAQMTVGGNSITIPKDETTPWQSSGGILAYWEGEGDATTASKPQLKLDTLRLAKLMALVPMTEELLQDNSAIESYLRMKAPAKMRAKLNTAIIRGTGVGQPLGLINGGATISVAKASSQDAATVWFENIVKMWSRLYSSCRANAVWLINQDVEPSLYQMAFDPEATSKVPVYLPPGGLSASPYGSLMGRPVIPVEACSTLGTQGDIILTDLTEYLAITKGQGVQTDVSMHLYFDQAITAFRFLFRVNGQPTWTSAITAENGSNSLSSAIMLDARA